MYTAIWPTIQMSWVLLFRPLPKRQQVLPFGPIIFFFFGKKYQHHHNEMVVSSSLFNSDKQRSSFVRSEP